MTSEGAPPAPGGSPARAAEEAELTDRFVLTPFADGALLLDLETGVAFTLNPAAAFVWQRRLAGGRQDEIAADLAKEFELVPEQASRDVAVALAPPAVPPLPPPIGDFWYERHGDLFRFSFKGRAVLEVSDDGERVRAVAPLTPSQAGLFLLALSPKLLALRGATVLHAGAVVRPDGTVLAFLGASGAGKTSAARAFVAAGLAPVSEDKLVIRVDAERAYALVSGEARISSWASRLGAELAAGGSGIFCSAAGLAATAEGDLAPLGEIVLVDSARRAGAAMVSTPLGPTRAAAELFPHVFYGSDARAAWRLQLATTAAIARALPVTLATMPDGLDNLRAEARRYVEATTVKAPPSSG